MTLAKFAYAIIEARDENDRIVGHEITHQCRDCEESYTISVTQEHPGAIHQSLHAGLIRKQVYPQLPEGNEK